jgi:guanylate kinase
MPNKGEVLLMILSSPSGAGKTTLAKKIQEKFNNFKISVSHTTRKPRPNEINGLDYFFVSKSEFENEIKKNSFYEHAKIFDNYYGTSKKSVDDLIKEGNDILFDIDWQGTNQLSKFKELNFIKIYLIPPSKDELKKRLLKRNQDTIETVKKRLSAFEIDRSHWNDYDYVIVNDNLEICFSQIEKIIVSHKNKKLI